MIEQLIAAAKSWRALAKFEVSLENQAGGSAGVVVVKLGDARRRWKRVAKQLEGISQADEIIGARGYDAAGELVGSWSAPDADAVVDEEEEEGGSFEHGHRVHTQWVMKEVSKIHETSQRLTIELVGAVIDVVRALRTTITTPVQQAMADSDDATKVLGQLLSAAMSNQASQARSNDGDEEITGDERPRSDAAVQGEPTERAPSGT